jgi:hypothetical protein
MSEAPHLELNINSSDDFDLSAPTNQFQQTQHNTPQNLAQMDNSSAAQPNGNTTQNLQNSAIKAKDGLLESKVSGTKGLRPLPRRNLTPYITVLSAARATPDFLNSHPQSSCKRHERRKQSPQRAEREGDGSER